MSMYEQKIHRWGRISGILAIVMFIAYPLLMSLYFNAWPYLGALGKGLIGVVPIFYTVGIIEALTYGPMLGAGGSYLGFVTGNITNLKAPCAINAMKVAKADPGTPEGEVVSTLAIGISSITSASFRHSTPSVALIWSSTVNSFLALVRLMVRPAPWLQLLKLSGLPFPRTMKLLAPMEPGMIPNSPFFADTAPLRVTSTSSPKCRSFCT